MNAIISIEDKKEIDRSELIRKHFGKELSVEELDLFGFICQRTQLDPFIKQIYPVKRKTKQSDGSYKDTMVVQVSIDGLRLIAERTGCYSPGREPSYIYDEKKNIISSTAYIKKMTADGTWHEVSATAFMCEYRPKYGQFWDNMPHLMLAKCAEALAIRKAFPAQTCKVYTPEEMAQASDGIEIISKESGSIEHLKDYLSKHGLPTDRLEEWIEMRAQTKNESHEKIIKACLGRDILPKFKQAFEKFITPVEPEILAV